MERLKKEIETIYKTSDTKATTLEDVAKTNMLKMMVMSIMKYIEKEADANSDFRERISLEFKNAERMLKYVWGKAKSLATNIDGIGAGCCVPDDVVYDWVSEYYFLDDKAEYEAEIEAKRKAKEEAERKAKEEEEKKVKAREKAIEKLSKEDGFEELSDEEKEKKIADEVKKILPRLGKKKTTPKKSKNDTKDESVDVDAINDALPDNARLVSFEESGLKDEVVASIDLAPKDEVKPEEEILREKEAQKEILSQISEDSEGQMSLLDLCK